MKAHLKRAPSLRGAALVRLSSLKIQAKPWPKLFNLTEALSKLDEVRNFLLKTEFCVLLPNFTFQLEITSDNWFENVLRIYNQRKLIALEANVTGDSQIT